MVNANVDRGGRRAEVWSPAMVAKLREHAAQGFSSVEIAVRLGPSLTAKAVQMKCQKLRIRLQFTDSEFHKTGGWTAERLHKVRELRDQGLSAAQIAEQIGHGLSRNSVIGKLKRLNDRRTSGKNGQRGETDFARHGGWTGERIATLRRLAESGMLAGEIACTIGHCCSKQSVIAKASALKIKLRKPPRQTSEKKSPNTEFSGIFKDAPEPLSTADGKPIGTLDLHRAHCKWPLGDPAKPDFRHCGLKRVGEGPYCDFHTRRARGQGHSRDEVEAVQNAARRTFARMGM